MVFNVRNSAISTAPNSTSNPANAGTVSGSSNTGNTSATSGTTASNAVDALKNMLAGDTFSGEISQINGNEVVLKMNNGLSLQALLLDNLNLNVGQTLTFMVNEISENKISIKPMQLNEQQAVLINRALDASNLSPNQKNVQLVQELLKQNMPIDMNTLTTLAKGIGRFPDANIDTIVRLFKLGIPITGENINQFEAYKSYEHSISNELDSLSKSFGDLLSSVTTQSGTSEAANLSQKIIDILYPSGSTASAGTNPAATESTSTAVPGNPAVDIDGNMEVIITGDGTESVADAAVSTNTAATANDKVVRDTAANAAALSEHSAESVSKFMGVESRKELAQHLIETFGKEAASTIIDDLKSGQLSAKSVLETINQLIKNNPDLNKELLGRLFESKEFTELTKMMVRDKLRIAPDDIQNANGIKEFYKRVREDISRLADAAPELKESSFSKNLEGLKHNIDFMNDLNKNMTYFQMPIKFSGSDANGELYVFTNKKSLASKSDNLSALLHLDMENLGPLDVFVKLAGKQVSTNFCLESEELLDFVYSHIDQLNDRLEKLGYAVKFEMTVREADNKGIDFVQDFIDQKQGSSVPSQFIFDTRA